MASPFAGTEPYEFTLVDKSDKEEWTVWLRPLNAGDQAKLLDQMAVEEGENEDDRDVTKPRLGTVKLLLVNEAVIRWTLPQPPTPHTIAALRPDLFDLLYDATKFAGDELGNPTSPASSTDAAPSTTPGTTSETDLPAPAAVAPAGES